MTPRLFSLFLFTCYTCVLSFAQDANEEFAASVQGCVYVDVNDNARFDVGDEPLKGVELIFEGKDKTLHTITDEKGRYVQQLSSRDYKARIVFSSAAAVLPSQYDLNDFGTSDALTINGIDFRIRPSASAESPSRLSIQPLSQIQNGQHAAFELRIQNGSAYAPEDIVSLKLEESFAYIRSQPSHHSQSKEFISWKVPALKPYATWTTYVLLDIASNSSQVDPSVQQFVYLSATLPTQSGAITENANYSIETLSNSENDVLKSNSKTIIGDVSYTPDDVRKGIEIMYFIRFQNTGNASVEDVMVIDSMDSRLIGSSFEMVSSSHPYQIIRNANNVVQWFFEGIHLPDSLTDADASQGFVLFKVRLANDLFPGDFVINRATIRFDGFAAKTTNPAVFNIREKASIDYIENFKDVAVFPNPSEGSFFLNIPNQDGTLNLSMTDLQGRILYKQRLEKEQNHFIQLPKLPCGAYVLYLQSNTGQYVEMLLLD